MTLNIKVLVSSEEGDMGTVTWSVYHIDEKSQTETLMY